MHSVWVVFDRDGYPRHVADNAESAKNFAIGFESDDVREYVHASKLDVYREQGPVIDRKLAELVSENTILQSRLQGTEEQAQHAADRADDLQGKLIQAEGRLDELQNQPTYRIRQEQAERIDHLEELLATAYQLAGLVGAPVRFLDAYSRHEGDIDSLLPVDLHELDEFKALQSRLSTALSLLDDWQAAVDRGVGLTIPAGVEEIRKALSGVVEKRCQHPNMIKAGERNNTNDWCPDCGWFPDVERQNTIGPFVDNPNPGEPLTIMAAAGDLPTCVTHDYYGFPPCPECK